MSKATKKSLLYALAALGLIALAMWLRYASRTVLHSPIYGHLRSGIYIFLLCAWCHSVRVRIVQTQVQRYLLAISMLMVLWLLLRSIKFSIANTDAALALVFLLCPDPLYPHALGIRLPVAGKAGGLSFAAVDKAVVCAGGAAPAARFNKRSASAGVFLSVRHFVGRCVPL